MWSKNEFPVKSGFLTELEVRSIDDKRWSLTRPLSYQSDLLDACIHVPEGFVTDFASVPRVPIVYTAFGDRAHRESVIHDYLYQKHLVSRKLADKIFLEAMKARGKKWWVRTGMYLGVRLGGRSSYKTGPARYLTLNKPF